MDILNGRSQMKLLPKVISREIVFDDKDIDALSSVLLSEFIDRGTKSGYEPTQYGARVEDLMDKINAMRSSFIGK
ncbi:MAG: hypothetical protein LBI61_01255 [Puniceicoccales bacterium]|nr:hypothetical protein [Puniceicoccales bacterium]